MNGFIALLRKEYIFSFIKVKSDKPFGCLFLYCSKIRIKESRCYDWVFHYNIKTCVVSKESS